MFNSRRLVLLKDISSNMSRQTKKPLTLVEEALRNEAFRTVIHTGIASQHTVMHIDVGKDVGKESHNADQTFTVVRGTCRAVINGVTRNYSPGDVFFVDGGDVHNVINTGNKPLKLISIYSPPIHLVDEVNKTPEDEIENTIIDTLYLLLGLKANQVLNITFWDKKMISYTLTSAPKLQTRRGFHDWDEIELQTDEGEITIIWKEKRHEMGSHLVENGERYEILQMWIQ